MFVPAFDRANPLRSVNLGARRASHFKGYQKGDSRMMTEFDFEGELGSGEATGFGGGLGFWGTSGFGAEVALGAIGFGIGAATRPCFWG